MTTTAAAGIVNVTKLAREFHATTPAIRKRLDKLGVMPLQEIEMPSGRKFVLYSQEAFEVLDQERRAREAPVTMNKPAPVEVKDDSEDIEALKAELSEIKSLLTQLLDMKTKPE